MGNVCRTLAISVFTTLLAAGTLTFADAIARGISYDLNIPSEDLTAALQSFAIASHHKLLYRAELTAGKTSQALKGRFTAQEAIEALLSGTDLTFEITGSSVVLIKDRSDRKTGDLREEGTLPASAPSSQSSGGQRFLLAQGNSTATSTNTSAPATNAGIPSQDSSSVSSGSERSGLSEIIVTAEKRAERLQDVPVPVAVLMAQDLVDSNRLRLVDYYSSVPGLSVVPGSSSAGGQTISIRGITTGAGSNPSVGYTIDDVPYGSATGLGDGDRVPDLDPSDLARVEVLKGPQGTLYGASSMGGLIKFVTVDPSTDGLSGRVEAGLDGVYNGISPGYNYRAAINVPLSDTLAIRLSGFTREDPGYTDNPVLHEEGVNEQHVSGGRFAAWWRPSEDFSLKVNALYQGFNADGVNDVTPGLGDLQQNYIRGTGGNSGNLEAYSATLTAKLGNVNLTALSGYNRQHGRGVTDLSYEFGALTQQAYGVGGAGLTNEFDTGRFTQEIRLSGSIGNRVDWRLGGVYTHEDTTITQEIPAINPTSGAVVAVGYVSTFPSTYTESAAFGDLTFHITDQFDVQAGLRQSEISQTIQTTTVEPLFTGSTVPIVGATENAAAHPLTYLLTPRFKVSEDLMVYARFASGYRVGGGNGSLCTVYTNISCQYKPDKTQNYEVGAKGDFLDHMLSLDASLYYINWNDIQLEAIDPVSHLSYTTNASRAKSQGVELSVQARPLTGLTVAAEGTYDDAVLTQTFPAVVTLFGPSGARLPYTSRFSGSVSIDQKFPIGSVTGSVGGLVSYVGDRLGGFAGTDSVPRQDLPAYVRTDLHLGAEYGTWTYHFFVNNVFDRRGLLEGPLETFPPALLYIQPRTIGMNVAKTF
jgi:outer membrane receptor protein involved in Fe transport